MSKNIILTTLVILFLGSLMGYALFACVRGSGNIVEKEYVVDDYKNIRMSINNATLYIDQAEVSSLIIEAEDNILKKIFVKNEDPETIKIYTRDFLQSIKPTKPIRIHVSTREINRILLDGSGIISSENKIKTDNLEINISGSGKVNLSVDVKNLETTILGFGDITFEGDADTHNFSLSGSGSLRASDLLTNQTNISISGSGSAEVSAIKELDINISGSGDVSYNGEPEKITQSISGLGKIGKSGSYFPANESNVLEALIKKAPELEDRKINLTIEQRESKHAHGKLEFIDSDDLQQIWLATLTDEGWIITHNGNSVIMCQEVNPYNFPVSMIDECYDLGEHSLVDRT